MRAYCVAGCCDNRPPSWLPTTQYYVRGGGRLEAFRWRGGGGGRGKKFLRVKPDCLIRRSVGGGGMGEQHLRSSSVTEGGDGGG